MSRRKNEGTLLDLPGIVSDTGPGFDYEPDEMEEQEQQANWTGDPYCHLGTGMRGTSLDENLMDRLTDMDERIQRQQEERRRKDNSPLADWLPERFTVEGGEADLHDTFEADADAPELLPMRRKLTALGEEEVASFSRKELLLHGVNVAEGVRRGWLIPQQETSPEQPGIAPEELGEAVDTLHGKEPQRRFKALLALLRNLEFLPFMHYADGSPVESFRAAVARRLKASPACLTAALEELAGQYCPHTTSILVQLLETNPAKWTGKTSMRCFEKAVALAADEERFSGAQRKLFLRAAKAAPVSGTADTHRLLLRIIAHSRDEEMQALASSLLFALQTTVR